MGFLKVVAVFLANLLTLTLIVSLSLMFIGNIVEEIGQQFGIDIPVVDISFGDLAQLEPQPVQRAPTTQQPLPRQISSSSHSGGASTSAINSSREMCQFWSNQFEQDHEPQSRVHRENACRRYERLSGNSRTNVVSRGTLRNADEQARREEQRILAERREYWEEQQRQKQELEQRCDRYNELIDAIDAELRSGYSVSRGNYLRSERREVSQKYSRECILGR